MAKKLKDWKTKDFINTQLEIDKLDEQITLLIARNDLDETIKNERLDTLIWDKQNRIHKAKIQVEKIID